MYLADTNIFLEGLLLQEKADSVRSFFQTTHLELIAISDLSLHSIGIILFRLGKYELFIQFLNDLIIDGMKILSLSPQELYQLDQTARNQGLDFDKTERGRKEPIQTSG